MTEETYSIWLQNSVHNKKIHNLIKRYASEENKDSFSPHVTLVSNINSKENALKILQKLSGNKSSIVFDKVSTGDTCLLYTSPSPRDAHESRMPSSA